LTERPRKLFWILACTEVVIFCALADGLLIPYPSGVRRLVGFLAGVLATMLTYWVPYAGILLFAREPAVMKVPPVGRPAILLETVGFIMRSFCLWAPVFWTVLALAVNAFHPGKRLYLFLRFIAVPFVLFVPTLFRFVDSVPISERRLFATGIGAVIGILMVCWRL